MYKSYMLRLWRDDTPGAAWRATLESITEPGERRHFPDMDSLIAFLLTNVVDMDRTPPESSGGS